MAEIALPASDGLKDRRSICITTHDLMTRSWLEYFVIVTSGRQHQHQNVWVTKRVKENFHGEKPQKVTFSFDHFIQENDQFFLVCLKSGGARQKFPVKQENIV